MLDTDGQTILLDSRGFCEFSTKQAFALTSDQVITVMGIISGQESVRSGAGFGSHLGDPSIFLVPPVRQARQDYVFVTPATYHSDFVTITFAEGTNITLDGQPLVLSNALPIRGATQKYIHVELDDGSHKIEGSAPFSIMVMAYDDFVSYAFVGGLNLTVSDRGSEETQVDQSVNSHPCLTACDCVSGLSCLQGLCTEGERPTYCCTQGTCPNGEACVDPSGDSRVCNTCRNTCDCPYGELCEAGHCVVSNMTVFCCERSPCPSGESCEGEGGPTCPSGCQTACDCWGGETCVNGICSRESEAAYCCERALCPQGSSCEYDDGSAGLCPVRRCTSACDCATGFACTDGECQLSATEGLTYCCEDAACPAGRSCQLTNGGMSTCVGEPQCSVSCDCPTAQICEAGRCIFPPNNEPLLLCCEEDCTELTSALSCERLNGLRSLCP
jgi:hypothetical protein